MLLLEVINKNKVNQARNQCVCEQHCMAYCLIIEYLYCPVKENLCCSRSRAHKRQNTKTMSTVSSENKTQLKVFMSTVQT